MRPRPYTKKDLERGESIVRALHGLQGFDVWAQYIAQQLAAEREDATTQGVASEQEQTAAYLQRQQYPDQK